VCEGKSVSPQLIIKHVNRCMTNGFMPSGLPLRQSHTRHGIQQFE
jgi:hypothetical protein